MSSSSKTSDRRNIISAERRRLVEELHAPARRNFPRRRVIVRGYDDLWQADIVEMRPYSRFNGGYHYILTVIDVLSKRAWAMPLKSKGGSETANAIAEIIRESGRCPKNLQTDHGKEFYNTDVRKLLKKHDINHYSTYSVLKASIVERFNRTLKNDMWKMFTLNGNYKWVDLLPRLMEKYNARKHRTICMRPIDVTPAAAEKLLDTVYSHVKIAGPARFKVGDSVRVSKYKTILEKGYTPYWTTEVFKISKVQRVPILQLTYSMIIVENPSLERSTNTSFIARLVQTCSSWRRYYAGRVMRFMSSGWDLMNHTTLGYTRITWFKKNTLFYVFET